MNPVLTITIESADYVNADKALRIKRDEFKPGIISGHALAIVNARRALGFSMLPRHLFIDFDPEIDERMMFVGAIRRAPIKETTND